MAANDHALVVGINRYRNHEDLRGPVRDALKFYSWLVSPKGGAVPRKQIKLLLSPLFNRRGQEGPDAGEIEKALNELSLPGRHGRLYLFFAGHGVDFWPSNPAILAADGNYQQLATFHVTGKAWCDYLSSSFNEVVLLMDCCRDDISKVVQPRNPPFPQGDGGGVSPTYVHGFATRWNRQSREFEFKNGVFVGKFSKCVTDALMGQADFNVGTRTLTADDVREFVKKKIALFDKRRAGPRLAHAQQVELLGPDLKAISFQVPATQPYVGRFVLEVTDSDPQTTLRLLDPALRPVQDFPMVGKRSLTLGSGLHTIQVVNDPQRKLELTVIGDMVSAEGDLKDALSIRPE